jgi:primosomal protein N' (replication factor Y) (superfamily II helicase)
MSREIFVQVAVDRPLDRLFEYRCPEGEEAFEGQRVRLTFGRSTMVGMVLDRGQVPNWTRPVSGPWRRSSIPSRF